MDVMIDACRRAWMSTKRRWSRRCGSRGDTAAAGCVTETFGTMTPDLLALREWLQAYGVTHVALESTGVYWKPVYYVLEDAFTLLLINMQELKHVPGPQDGRERQRVAGAVARVRVVAGELRAAAADPRTARSDAVSGAASPRPGAGGQSALQGARGRGGEADDGGERRHGRQRPRDAARRWCEGTTDPTILAELARGKLRKKLPDLRRALAGPVSAAPRVSARAGPREDRFSR